MLKCSVALLLQLPLQVACNAWDNVFLICLQRTRFFCIFHFIPLHSCCCRNFYYCSCGTVIFIFVLDFVIVVIIVIRMYVVSVFFCFHILFTVNCNCAGNGSVLVQTLCHTAAEGVKVFSGWHSGATGTCLFWPA